MVRSQVDKSETFLYFSYGDHMFSFRMHMHCPSAEFVSIGRLDNYRLAFHKHDAYWAGPEATIVPTANAQVWGVIWRINSTEKPNLDYKVGLIRKKYFTKDLDILTSYMGYFNCRTYIQRVNPLPMGDNDPIPAERYPSITYKQVMILGAVEHDFPPFYIDFLKNLQDNDQEGYLRVDCLCIRYGRDPPCECFVPGKIPRKPLSIDLNEWRNKRAKRGKK